MLGNVFAKMSESFLKKKKGYIIKYYNDNYRLEPLKGVKSVTYLLCPQIWMSSNKNWIAT